MLFLFFLNRFSVFRSPFNICICRYHRKYHLKTMSPQFKIFSHSAAFCNFPALPQPHPNRRSITHTHYPNDGLSNEHLDGKSGSLFHQHQRVIVPIAMAIVVGRRQQLRFRRGAHHHEREHRQLQHTAYTVGNNVHQMVCDSQIQTHLSSRHWTIFLALFLALFSCFFFHLSGKV